jgi:hypothetical protein
VESDQNHTGALLKKRPVVSAKSRGKRRLNMMAPVAGNRGKTGTSY